MSKQIIATYLGLDETANNNYKFKVKDKEHIFICAKKEVRDILNLIPKEDYGTENAMFEVIVNKKEGLIYLNEIIKYDLKKQKSLIDIKPVVETVNISKEEPVFRALCDEKEINILKSQGEVFNTLSKLRPKTEKKGNFDYISWSLAWSDIMKHYPNSTHRVIKNSKGFPAFIIKEYGGYVEVAVIIEGVERTEIFPIMNNFNKTHLTPTITDINKSLKRALVKCLAYFGYGLHLYSGEELEE